MLAERDEGVTDAIPSHKLTVWNLAGELHILAYAQAQLPCQLVQFLDIVRVLFVISNDYQAGLRAISSVGFKKMYEIGDAFIRSHSPHKEKGGFRRLTAVHQGRIWDKRSEAIQIQEERKHTD